MLQPEMQKYQYKVSAVTHQRQESSVSWGIQKQRGRRELGFFIILTSPAESSTLKNITEEYYQMESEEVH